MTRRTVISIAAAAFALGASATIQALDDWPQWRGPRRDGVSAERGLLKVVAAGRPTAGLEGRRRRRGVLVVRGGAGAALHTRRARRTRVCHGVRRRNRQTRLGKRRTAAASRTTAVMAHAARPLSTAIACTRSGRSGDLTRARRRLRQGGVDGERHPRFRRPEHPVGAQRVPARRRRPDHRQSRRIGIGDRGGQQGRMGSCCGRARRTTAGYSSAVLHEVGGIRQAIVFTGQRALGIDVSNGSLLWSYDRVANRVANIATPIVRGEQRVPVVRLRHGRRASAAQPRTGGTSRPARSISRARCGITTRARCSSAITCTGSRARSSPRCASIPAKSPGAIAASARDPSSTPTSGCICSANAASWRWPKRSRPAIASTAV